MKLNVAGFLLFALALALNLEQWAEHAARPVNGIESVFHIGATAGLAIGMIGCGVQIWRGLRW